MALSTKQEAAVKADKLLQDEAQVTGEKLMKLRWKWTRDESNAERMSVREYAKAVGLAYSTVATYAKGWELLGDLAARSVNAEDARQLANVAPERREALMDEADAEGTSVRNVLAGGRGVAEQLKADPSVADAVVNDLDAAIEISDAGRRQSDAIDRKVREMDPKLADMGDRVELLDAAMKARGSLRNLVKAMENVTVAKRRKIAGEVERIDGLVEIIHSLANGETLSDEVEAFLAEVSA